MYRENNPPKKPLGTDIRKYILYAPLNCRLLFGEGGGVQDEEGVFLGNVKDSGWEDWGTLGKIGRIATRDP